MSVPTVRRSHLLLSCAIIAGAMLLHRALAPELRNELPGLIYLPAVGLCAFIGGAIPGALAIIAAFAGKVWFHELIPPHHDTWLRTILVPVLFLSGSVCIVLVCEALRRAEAGAKRIAAELEAGAREQRAFADAVPVMLWVEDPDGSFTQLNRFAREFSGRDLDDVQNFDWGKGIHPDFVDHLIAAKIRSFETGEEFREEFRSWHAPTQAYRWVHVTTRAVRDDSGTIVNWVGCGVDIEDRVQAQESLRTRTREQAESLDLLDTLFGEAPIGFGYLDASLRYRRVNDTMARLNRVPQEQTIGRTVREVMGPDGDTVLPLFESILRTGHAVLNYELVRHLPGGDMAYRVLNYYPVRAGGEEIVGIGALVQDVTDRRLAEAAAETWRARYEAAIEAGGQLVFDWTPGTREVTYGGNVHGVLGHTPETLGGGLGQWLDDIVLPADRAFVAAQFDEVASHDGRLQVEYRIRRADGAIRHVEHTGRFLRATAHATRRLVGFVTDITDRARAREDMQRRAEELRAANRAKEQFLAMLAHELRNPLAAILHADYALENLAPSAEQSAQLRGIVSRQTQHLARLVDDLLDVSRVTQGKVELKRSAVSLAAVAQRAVESCRAVVDARSHVLKLCAPAEPVMVWVDATRLEQVVVNLLTNAAKFTDPGGRIDVAVERRADTALLRVRDSGVGMTSDMMERAFDLFTQADGSLDRSNAGLGIGLTLVRTLVELHGGSVRVHSDGPGRGCEFTVELACALGAAPPDGGAGAGTASDGAMGHLRIMVVEDDPDVAVALRSVLQTWGHSVVVASSGTECIRRAPVVQPDVLLLDIGLPGADGFTVAEQLRSHPALAHTLFVAVSGYGQPDDVERSRAAGCNAHLTKPVTAEELRAVLARAGERSGASSGAIAELPG